MNKLFLIVSVSVVQVVVRDYQKHDVYDDGRRAVSALKERYQLTKEQDYSQNDRENGLFVGKGKSDKSCQNFESVKCVKSYKSAEGSLELCTGKFARGNIRAQNHSDADDGYNFESYNQNAGYS